MSDQSSSPSAATTESPVEETAVGQTVERAESAERFESADFPKSPGKLTKASRTGVLKRTLAEFSEDQGTDAAAALTYYSIFSLFPLLIATFSLLGVFGQGQATTDALLDIVEELGLSVDRGPDSQIISILNGFQEGGGAGLALVLSLATSLYAASNYVNAFSRTMNRVYEVSEGRPFLVLKVWMFVVTALLLGFIIIIAASLVLSGGLVEAIGSTIGLSETAVTVWGIAKWPVLALLVIGMITLLYYATPNVKQPGLRWVAPGAVLAFVTICLAMAGFAIYVTRFGGASGYAATYGAIAGVIIALLVLYIVNTILVLGAELNAELERGRELQAGVPAEVEIQLPPRSTAQAEKVGQKAAVRIQQSRELRITKGDPK